MADTVNTAARAAQASSRTPMRRRGRLVCLICSIVFSLIRSGDIPAGGGSSTEPSSQPSSRSVIRTGTGIPPFHQQLFSFFRPRCRRTFTVDGGMARAAPMSAAVWP